MILVAQQPNYFPWLGYLEQLERADCFVVLDDVQWIRSGWQRRARILSQTERVRFQWLSLPLHQARQHDFIKDLILDPASNWPLKHWNKLVSVYGHRPYFESQIASHFKLWFESLDRRRLQGEVLHFCDVMVENLLLCSQAVGMSASASDSNRSWIRSSTLGIDSMQSERLVRVCQSLNADVYYSGIASTQYLDVSVFRGAEIQVQWQRWRHPSYEQGAKDRAFVSHLSCLDALANMPAAEIAACLKPKRIV